MCPRRLHLVAVLVTLLLAILACAGVETSPSVSNIRMTTDEGGQTTISSYTPSQEFFVYADVEGLQAGSIIEARWYAVDVQDLEPNHELSTSDYAYEAGIGHVYFQLSTADGGDWPPGSYRVELYLNGNRVGEKGFAVR